MSKFLFIYHGGEQPETPEAVEAYMARWGAWMQENNFADVGTPVGMSKTVSKDGVVDNGGPNPVAGYSVLEAADMDAALAVAKTCPIHDGNGSLEVAEFFAMSMDGS